MPNGEVRNEYLLRLSICSYLSAWQDDERTKIFICLQIELNLPGELSNLLFSLFVIYGKNSLEKFNNIITDYYGNNVRKN